MRKVESPQGRWQNIVFFLTALLIVTADQLSKAWIRDNLDVGKSLPETGLFQLSHVQNTGVAFGLFQNHSFPLTIVIVIGTAIILLFTLFIYRRLPLSNIRLGKPALGLVLGGTIGNLIDRLRLGYVTDFLDISIWPAFNIADSSVVVGVILFAYSLFATTRVKNSLSA